MKRVEQTNHKAALTDIFITENYISGMCSLVRGQERIPIAVIVCITHQNIQGYQEEGNDQHSHPTSPLISLQKELKATISFLGRLLITDYTPMIWAQEIMQA